MLKARDPALAIEPTSCPPRIDVSGGKVAWCVLRVNGVSLPVRVAYYGPAQNFKVNFDGPFFERAWIETYAKKELAARYGISAQIQCPLPVVTVLHVGANVTCTVSGSPKVAAVSLTVHKNGEISLNKVPGLAALDAPPDAVLQKHKLGETVVLSGPEVERYISRAYLSVVAANPANLTVTCPPQVDLSGSKRAVCIVGIKDKHLALRMSVWIDDASGLRELPLDAVIDKRHVAQSAQADWNQRLRLLGLRPDTTVDCGEGVVVVPVGGSFACRTTAGGKTYKLIVTAKDANGTVSWRGASAK